MSTSYFILFTFATLAALSLGQATSQTFLGSQDEVTSLPGLSFKPKFRHYSGYLETVNQTYLHYWFFESQNSTNDPVVLWLNGGPGCSSVLGSLTEQGPINIKPDGRLVENAYAWNLRANMIFLESPAGVGFSYKADNNFKTGDSQTAISNYAALKSFFVKFPHLALNDFYIAGESYGGIYVPTLSVHVFEGKYPKNFKGFAVGNAFLDATMLGNSMLHFAYNHGLFDTILWDELVSSCCSGVTNVQKCDFVNTASLTCKLAILKVQSKLSRTPLNLYNIYSSCNQSSGSSTGSVVKLSREHVEKRFILKHALKLDLNELETSASLEPPCMNFEYVEQWLNQKAVRDAMHIRPESGYWSPCSAAVSAQYVHEYSSVKKQFQYLLHNGLKALIYNGDVDAMCNFLGDQW